ncbi:MAG: hypothetical protein QOD38_73 [Acidimicrobiaceae bacterium]
MATAITTRTQPTDRWERIAGVGGITFAAIVGASNVVVPNPPAWDASGAEISTWVHDHHAVLAMTVGAFALTAPALVAFVAGYVLRVFRSDRTDARAPALIGAGGALLIGAMFFVVEVARTVLLASDGSAGMTAGVTEVVWHLEGAAFSLNMVAIGIAVFGFALAGARVGVLPSWYGGLGVVALAAAILSAAPVSATVNGSNGWQIGLVTFLSWLVLLLVAGTRMLRQTAG